ncbi:g5025 [Coccomyxa elongata]
MSNRGFQKVSPQVTSQKRHRRHQCALCAQQLGSNTIFPPYTVVSNQTKYDLRFFDAYPVIRMPYERRDEGYIGLGAYFDGDNSEGVRLRQTQPVVMRFSPGGSKTMELYIGCQQDGQPLEALPQPKDSRLSLEVAGGEVAAVLKFEGNATREATLQAVAQLKNIIASDGLKLAEEEAAGAFRLAQYGPLNSLSTRVNEVLLRVLV